MDALIRTSFAEKSTRSMLLLRPAYQMSEWLTTEARFHRAKAHTACSLNVQTPIVTVATILWHAGDEFH